MGEGRLTTLPLLDVLRKNTIFGSIGSKTTYSVSTGYGNDVRRPAKSGYRLSVLCVILLMLIGIDTLKGNDNPYRYTAFAIRPDFPFNNINFALTDSEGFIWLFEMQGGIYRFDGHEALPGQRIFGESSWAERRVGKACVGRGKSGGWPENKK